MHCSCSLQLSWLVYWMLSSIRKNLLLVVVKFNKDGKAIGFICCFKVLWGGEQRLQNFRWHCVAWFTPVWMGRTELATRSLCFETRLMTKHRRKIVVIHSELQNISTDSSHTIWKRILGGLESNKFHDRTSWKTWPLKADASSWLRALVGLQSHIESKSRSDLRLCFNNFTLNVTW